MQIQKEKRIKYDTSMKKPCVLRDRWKEFPDCASNVVLFTQYILFHTPLRRKLNDDISRLLSGLRERQLLPILP
jgi:hypothetical protein